MSAYRQFDDDDLAMYAMGVLDGPEAVDVARAASEDAATRARLAAVQAHLATYAETAVTLEEVPVGSLDRLLGRIAQERRVLPIGPRAEAPAAATFLASDTTPTPSRTGWLLPWIGWAVAAAMTVAAGGLYWRQAGLTSQLRAEAGHAAQSSSEAQETARQRDTLAANAAAASQRATALDAEKAEADKAAELARTDATREGAAREQEAARASEQGARLNEQTARLNELNAQLADATRQRSALDAAMAAETARLAEETSQVDRLRTEVARAREVQDALTDRTALRVTLTAPKSKPEPTGRATYVASRGTLVFQGSSLAAPGPNKVHELWILPADGSAPLPARTFSPDARGNATLVSPRLAGAVEAKAFAITIENEGGATTPTMPILLVGAAG